LQQAWVREHHAGVDVMLPPPEIITSITRNGVTVQIVTPGCGIFWQIIRRRGENAVAVKISVGAALDLLRKIQEKEKECQNFTR
jgi:hypothetical protein